MLAAVSYLQPVGRGVTAPHLFLADDGETYVVKFQSNRLGPKVLVNEWLAASLGKRWQLCFPPSGMVYLSQAVIEQGHLTGRVQPGIHFGSQFLPRCRYLNRILLHRTVNKADMAGVILFDHLFHNVDRTHNPRNLLAKPTAEGWRIYAIDHSHLFFRGRWTTESLSKLAEKITINGQRSFGALLRNYLRADDFLPFLRHIEATADTDFAAVVGEIPREWLPGDEERDFLIRWLCRRRGYAAAIVDQLCRFVLPPF